MIDLGGPRKLVEKPSELPGPVRGATLYLDCETRGPSELEYGRHPYSGDRACGWAITWDDHELAYYVPVRHRSSSANLDPDAVARWLKDWVRSCERWTNHSVKFDAHFAAVEGAVFDCELLDTNTQAKIVDSDRMSHELKPLLRDWLEISTDSQDQVKAFLAECRVPGTRKRAKDFALVPVDILGYYACDDVLGNRALHLWLNEKMPEQCKEVWKTEQLLTPVLWDMEHAGVRVDPNQLQRENLLSLHKMVTLASRITELAEIEHVDSIEFSYDVLVNRMALPILARHPKTKRPTFNAEALQLYLGHPEVASDPEKTELIQSMLAFRKESTYRSLYVEAFLERMDENGKAHPGYNQIIRTGRMSSRDPNIQQQSLRSKQLIWPDPGNLLWSSDASQIEFRVIVHYTNDEEIIGIYVDDPRTDFHQWVADVCGVERSPAKNVNFGMGYGAGQKRTTQQLLSDPSIIKEVGAAVDAMIENGEIAAENRIRCYARLCEVRAREVQQIYHDRLPGIKATSKLAAKKARTRGYVFNAYGRRRHLPPKAAHVAFNTLCQGTAMDYIKAKMNLVAPRYNSEIRGLGVELMANVHDELLFQGPEDAMRDPRTAKLIDDILEESDGKLRVPIVWDSELHEGAWKSGAKSKPRPTAKQEEAKA